MNELKFEINRSKGHDIVKHLNACKYSFVPPLSTYVNIEQYAIKIEKNGIRFEMWDRDELIGLLAVYINKENQTLFVTNLSVLPSFKGKGIAHKLFQNLINKSKNHSEIKQIELEVHKDNIDAIAFYLRYGFVKQSCQQFHFKYIKIL